mmetsp:Transcript_29097/g.81443  ORF Transcript_29097/g.81443 Transcript_29097/m.81443 type:complete len:280 (+) Transcript_29097:429-1268(+)
MTRRIVSRWASSGISTSNRRGMRRRTASSRSNGRLVAPMMRTRSMASDFSPSHMDMNSFLILRIASCSPSFSRLPSMLSTSSIKMTQGASRLARENTALTYFSPSPNHLLPTTDMEMFIKYAPDAVATALAMSVLPVPGGPNRRIPLQGFERHPLRKNSGRCSGSITISRRAFFTSSSAPTSDHRTPISDGATTSAEMRFSNSFRSISSSFPLPPPPSCIWCSVRAYERDSPSSTMSSLLPSASAATVPFRRSWCASAHDTMRWVCSVVSSPFRRAAWE